MSFRPLVFDVTHLVSRLPKFATTGIDRVDLGYARYFIGRRHAALGAHYGAFRPHIFSHNRARRLVLRAAGHAGDMDLSVAGDWDRLRRWLRGQGTIESSFPELTHQQPSRSFFRQSALRIVNDPPFAVPKNAIYLNVSQTGFEHHQMFRWLDKRPDVTAVFLVHDFLPRDAPHLFRPNYDARFEKRVATIVRHADALICASDVVGDRIRQEYRRRNVEPPSIATFPFASPLGGRAIRGEIDAKLAEHSYFVMLGTLEPRKGHALLLDAWEQMDAARRPKLVMVGAPGWGVGDVVTRIANSQTLRDSVVRLTGVSRRTLRRLIVNARALVLPSLAEGYGLPIAEALSLGTPVICSDLPVFRETSQGKAEFLPARDLDNWREAIEDFSDASSERWQAAKKRANAYDEPTRESYFKNVSDFLNSL